jgi:hypothetical protein
MPESSNKSDFLPEIRMGRICTLKVHQISDEELNQLEQGSGQNLFLSLSLSILSSAISFLIAIFTTKIESDRTFNVFVIIIVIGLLTGIVLLILWWNARKKTVKLAKTIRDRMQPEGELESFDN